jgi:hypothetical protein
VEEDAAGRGAGILEREAKIRNGDGEQIVVERADDRSRVWIRCICAWRPRGELRFSVVAKGFLLVSGVSYTTVVALLYTGIGGRGREDGGAREENAQFLEVIKRRYVLWVKPLVEKEDVEHGRQG